MKDVLLKAGARVQNRNIHPSLSQLYRILYFWTTCLKFGVWEDYSSTHQCTTWTITTFTYADSKIHYPS